VEEGSFIKISIQDNGVGIPAEHQANILKDSFNFSAKGTLNESGSGLGLLLCKEYTGINGGSIGFSSEVNVGSTFWFTLPKV
jgi:signal transduction histidine kinase